MQADYLRLAVILIVGIIVGLSLGAVWLCCTMALVAYFVYQYRVLQQLLSYLQDPNKEPPVDMPGISNELFREFSLLHNQHKKNRSKLSSILKRFQESTISLPDAAIVLNQKNEIQWANNKAEEYLDIHWPKDSGQRLSNLVRDANLVDYLTNGQALNKESSLRLASPFRNGIILEFRVVSYGAKQKLLIARNITENYHFDQIQRDFISNASHELRTPLTVVIGYLESFKQELDQYPFEWQYKLQRMSEQSQRMQRLINELLSLSALEADMIQRPCEVIDVPAALVSIIAEAKTLSGQQAGGRQSHWFSDSLDQKLLVYAHKQNLYSIYSNIIFNAVHHSMAGTQIMIRWYRDPLGVHLEVEDTGPGIEDIHLPRLTERFYRVDKSRSREMGGTGLGLAIVKHMLDHYNGSLHIESKFGQGSLFRCTLPSSLARQKSVQIAACNESKDPLPIV